MTTATLPRPARPDGTAVSRFARRLIRGRAENAAWERPVFLGLLGLTALLYLWGLGASGWANSFYSAAVQAGAVNWEAFFFGSSDAANSITVDKPPASLWVMALSVRLFGLSSWSILVPQALMGVGTVAIVVRTVRRRFSAGAALLAGGVLALTPVAVLMFRFNNPDALLVLLLTAATALTLRAVETGKLTFLLWAGVAVGFGFLTKQLQAFLILPVLAGVYLWAAPRRLWTRVWHLLAALGAVLVAAGWWVAIVELVPADLRPYIGGSQTNDFLELTFGYNGLGRLTGDETGSVTGGGAAAAGGGMWGETGLLRLFGGEVGGQIAWLLPAALVLSVIGFVLLRRAPRTDPRRATLVAFAGWLVLTAAAFSFMAGIFHAYYTVALAPAVAVAVGVGADLLWQRRTALWARAVLAALLLGSAVWAWVLLDRAEGWLPWLKFAVAGAALAAGVLLLLPGRRRLAGIALALAVVSVLAGPAAYSLETASTPHTGSIVSAGPAVASSFGGGRPGAGGFPARGGFPGMPPGAARGATGPAGGTGQTAPTGAPGGAQRGFGGAGGLLGGGAVSTAVVNALSQNAGAYTWVAATVGSNNASGYQLESGYPVMALGGFNGSDPSPTLEEFQSLVASGRIHWFIGSGSLGQANGGSDAAAEIAAWVEANFAATEVDGVTLYELG